VTRSTPREPADPASQLSRDAARAATTDREQVSLRSARMVLWLAVIVPFIYTTSKTAADVSAGGVSAWDAARGVGPAVLWALSIAIAPTCRRGFGWVEVALVTFCAATLLSVLVPENPAPMSSFLKSASMIFVVVAALRLVRMYREPREVVLALIGFVHVVLLAGAVQLLLFRGTVYTAATGAAAETSDGLSRLNLVVPQVSANPLALLGIAGVLSCVVGVGPRWLHFNPVVRNGLVVLYTYLIILTRTRSAIAVGLLIIGVALLVRMRRKPLSTLAIMIGLTIAAVTVIPGLVPEFHTFLQRGQTTQGLDTLSGRTVIWDAARHTWEQNRTFGLGYYTGHRLAIPGLNVEQSNIDNTWLETLVDVGIVGFLPLALFAILGLFRLVRSKELRGDVRLWAIGMAVYTLAISFVNPTIQTPGAGQVVLTLLLLAVLPRPRSQPETES